MINFGEIIKESLSTKFGILFDVKQTISKSLQEYYITPASSDNNYFDILVTIKNDVRLIIECIPSKYGAGFLQFISESSENERTIFIDYWDKLDSEIGAKITLKINELPIDKKEFKTLNKNWNKFHLRFTKSPYREDNEDLETIVLKYICVVCGMILSIANRETHAGFEEGNVKYVMQKKYERNPSNRELCLYSKGYNCAVCGFNFQKTYGSIGENFIEVHHIIPVSQLGDGYILDPIKDLVPLCSNCHSMIHRSNPPFSVEELKNIILSQKSI